MQRARETAPLPVKADALFPAINEAMVALRQELGDPARGGVVKDYAVEARQA